MKIIYRFILIFIISSSSFPSQENSGQEEIAVLKTLESALGLSSDKKIIQYIEKLGNVPDASWEKIILSAMPPLHDELRYYLFYRFSENVPYHEEQITLNNNFTALCKDELLQFIQKEMPDDADVKRILLVLGNVKVRKIKALLPETTMLIAYSLHNVRKAANEAIYEIKDDRLFPMILSLAQSKNPVERTYAVDTLYYLKDERTIPVLLQLLNDKNKSVRYYTIRSLDALNAQEAIPYYIRILRSDINDEVRIMSAKVIGKTRPPIAFHSLLDVVYDPNPMLRDVVLDALFGYNFSAAAVPVSRQLSLETEKDLKIKEIKLLLSLGNSGHMAGLAKILKDEKDIDVRLWGIYATGVLQDPGGYELLLDNVGHENPLVREEAALSLAGFKYKKSVPYLLTLLKNKKEKYNVQAAALLSLKSHDDNSSMPDLFEESIKHPDIAVRAEIKSVLQYMLNKRFR